MRIARGSVLEILFYLVCVGAAVNKDLLDASVRQELQRVLDQRHICQGQETLCQH